MIASFLAMSFLAMSNLEETMHRDQLHSRPAGISDFKRGHELCSGVLAPCGNINFSCGSVRQSKTMTCVKAQVMSEEISTLFERSDDYTRNDVTRFHVLQPDTSAFVQALVISTGITHRVRGFKCHARKIFGSDYTS